MNKHTPGPWDVTPIRRNHGEPDDQSFFAISYFPFVSDNDGNVQTRLPVTDANAALIAAAPELLEASKQLIIQMESMDAGGEDSGYYLFLQDLRAAIAKAEGR